MVGLVPLRDVRRDLGRCEVSYDCTQVLVVICKRERHRSLLLDGRGVVAVPGGA